MCEIYRFLLCRRHNYEIIEKFSSTVPVFRRGKTGIVQKIILLYRFYNLENQNYSTFFPI